MVNFWMILHGWKILGIFRNHVKRWTDPFNFTNPRFYNLIQLAPRFCAPGFLH